MEITDRESTNRVNLPTTQDILDEAFSPIQNKADLFERVPEAKARQLIGDSIARIAEFESVSGYPAQEGLLPKTAEDAQKIKAIWVLSGPGYYSQPIKDDRYKDKPWAKWMNRNRADRAAWLARRITEIRMGQILPNDPEVIKQAIAKDGPMLIYNGRADENQEMHRALTNKKAFIPVEKVFITGEGIDRTTDQVAGFRLPDGMKLNEGEQIALVTHGPHAVRVLHLIQRVVEKNNENPYLDPNFPFKRGITLKVSPVHSTADGLKAYSLLEINGILHYLYYDQTQPASEVPYPDYIL